MGSGYRLFYFVEVIAFMIFLDFKVLYDMKDFKVLFVLFVLFCSQGVWAQKWEAPNWKNFSYPVIDFKDKAAGTKGAQIYRRIVPEPEAFIQQHALWVAQTLYWSATDSMPGVEKIEYNLEDTDGISAKGGQPPVVNIFYSSRWVEKSEDSQGDDKVLYETRGVLYHELTHAYQLEPQGIGGYKPGTEFWVFIEGMALAVNDMAIYDRMTPDFLRQRLDFINGADLVVLETNLPEESIRWLCDNCKAPILADPVSTIKAEKLRPVLGKLAALKPNRLEAELLSSMSIRTREDAAQAARKLLDTGLGTVFISLGAEGIYAADRSGDTAWVPCARCTVANATGGGDAVAAALAARMVRGDSLAETARWAVGAGALACEAETTINPAMSWDNIETILNRR